MLAAIKARRSIRRYLDRPVPKEIIETLLEAACWAPSAHNRQPWRFAVISAEKAKSDLSLAMAEKLRCDLTKDAVPENIIAQDVDRSIERITGSPTLILLSLSMQDMDHYQDEIRNNNEWLMAVQSTAMAGQNLLLTANDLGLAACWMCAPLFAPEIVKACLALPIDWHPQALITIGYPAEEREKSRKAHQNHTLYLD